MKSVCVWLQCQPTTKRIINVVFVSNKKISNNISSDLKKPSQCIWRSRRHIKFDFKACLTTLRHTLLCVILLKTAFQIFDRYTTILPTRLSSLHFQYKFIANFNLFFFLFLFLLRLHVFLSWFLIVKMQTKFCNVDIQIRMLSEHIRKIYTDEWSRLHACWWYERFGTLHPHTIPIWWRIRTIQSHAQPIQSHAQPIHAQWRVSIYKI